MSRFKVGDVVKIGMGKDRYPAWDYGVDRGPVINYAFCEVVFVAALYFKTRVDDLGNWTWPDEGNLAYSPDQWDREGWPVLVCSNCHTEKKSRCSDCKACGTKGCGEDCNGNCENCKCEETEEADGKCGCDMDTIMSRGCQCGGK
jgi:hypothetical protein